MAGITTTTILRGPAFVAFNGGLFYSESNIQVKLISETFAPKADGFPALGKRVKDRKYEITMKLIGEWESLGVLFPHGNTALGSYLFNNTSLVIWTNDGVKRTFSNAAVTKMPGVSANVGTILGDVTFTALLKDGAEPGDSDAYVVIGSGTPPVTGIGSIITPVWTCAYGSGVLETFRTGESGVVFDFGMEVSPIKVAGLGTVQMALSGRSVTARFTPVGVTEAEILALVNSNTAMGASPSVADLVVSGTGAYIAAYSAQLEEPTFNFHTQTDRIGELLATASQTWDTGASNPLFYVGTSAPA